MHFAPVSEPAHPPPAKILCYYIKIRFLTQIRTKIKNFGTEFRFSPKLRSSKFRFLIETRISDHN